MRFHAATVSSPSTRCRLAAASAGIVLLAAVPNAARADTHSFTSLAQFLAVTRDLTLIDFEGTAPDNDQADYSETGLTIGDATFTGKSINEEHLTYIFNGEPVEVIVGPDELTDLFANDGANGPEIFSVDGTDSLLTGFNETLTFNADELGDFSNYRDRFTLQAVFEVALATPQTAFGIQYRGIDVIGEPLQQYNLQLFLDDQLVGDGGTITGIDEFTPDAPLFIGVISNQFFNRAVFTGINPPSPTELGFFDSSGSLGFDNALFGLNAAPEPTSGALVTVSLAAVGAAALGRRRRTRRFGEELGFPE